MLDLHNHVLYGLDDGCRTLLESQALAERARAVGHVGFVATPHIRAGMFDNTVDRIRARRDEVQGTVTQAGLELHLGAEYYFDEHLLTAARERRLLTLGETSRYVLVEFPQAQLPLRYDAVLFELRTLGYVPVIAHPERCRGVERDLEASLEALRRVALLQLDLGSLLGRYGDGARRTAQVLVKRGAYQVAAGDLHRPDDAQEIIPKAQKELKKLLPKGHSVEAWCLHHPRQILANAPPEELLDPS